MAPKKHDRSASAEEAYRHPSTKRAKEIDAQPPFDELCELVASKSDQAPRNVLHWFRSKDLRQEDNTALASASNLARQGSGHLITMYMHSPADLQWHGASAARVDFILESLRILQSQLEGQKHIPLTIITVEKRGDKTARLLDFVREHDISHVFADMEYEVDELRRDIDIAKKLREEGVSFESMHDQTVVRPNVLTTGSGSPHKVFTPYYKAWLAWTKDEMELPTGVEEPKANEEKVKEDLAKLFGSEVPGLPKGKEFASEDEKERIRKTWPPGHEAGIERLNTFLKEKVSDYAAHRSEPARDPSSRLSPYLAAGVISAREVINAALEANDGKHFDGGDAGIVSWVRELVFREFYRQQMVITPHNAMNLPQNLKFDFVQWEEDEEGWQKWCEGRTGVPFIDAGMRQLNTEAYMHNRLRMNTASYLRANMLIDYRRGERYFAEHLIDWDLSNNTQGWEPSYTIFNPVIQAEKCDKDGEYIRKWVPELAHLKGKEIFAPHERLSKEDFEKLDYPAPHVDFAESQQRAKARYKQDLAEADP